MSKSTDEQDELVDRAWDLVKEALTNGTMTLAQADGKVNSRILGTEDIIDLAKFFVTIKVKKPQLISPPEDYHPIATDGDSDED
jgi:hypothetical protein